MNAYHMMSVFETWLLAHISHDLVRVKNHYLIRADREGKEGGDAACYINESLRADVIATSTGNFSNLPQF